MAARKNGNEMDCLLLVDEPRSGPENMAIDQAMVERAASDGLVLARIYAWSTPTLSLGYFQRASDQAEQATTLGMPVVRRATGGGAIVHHFDWTYSIAIPVELSQRLGASAPLYDTVHESVVQMLGHHGLEAKLCQPTTDGPGCGKCSFLCFERRSAGDVLIGDYKVLGSAQRRIPGGLVQHGSLLLATSPHAPSLPGVEELAKQAIDQITLSQDFQVAITQAVSRFAGATVDLVKRIADLVPKHEIFDVRQFADEKWTLRTP